MDRATGPFQPVYSIAEPYQSVFLGFTTVLPGFPRLIVVDLLSRIPQCSEFSYKNDTAADFSAFSAALIPAFPWAAHRSSFNY